MGSEGISVLMGGAWGAPEITTSGGAGEVLSFMGERRGVMGAPPWRAGASGAWRLGELTEGDEGPEDTADCLWAGWLGDFDFSLDFVRERFCNGRRNQRGTREFPGWDRERPEIDLDV